MIFLKIISEELKVNGSFYIIEDFFGIKKQTIENI